MMDFGGTSRRFQPQMTPRKLRFLFCLRGDRTRASSRVRGYWIAEELERLGHECTVLETRQRGNMLAYLRALASHDVAIFQKRTGRRDPLMVQFARSLRVRTLYDIDDLPRQEVDGKTRLMLSLVDGVLAGSPELAEFARTLNKDVTLLPSGILLDNYPLVPLDRQEKVPCIGWIGNGADYADDLIKLLRPPLVALASRRPIHFKIIGACGEERLHTAFRDIPGLSAEIIDQIDWGNPASVAAEIAEFDIGVYPLLDTEFNRHKCGFKALEYMASGLPVVASPVGALAEMITEDVGFASRAPDAWLHALDRLSADPGLRRRLGHAGRRMVERRYSTRTLARSILTSCGAQQETSKVTPAFA